MTRTQHRDAKDEYRKSETPAHKLRRRFREQVDTLRGPIQRDVLDALDDEPLSVGPEPKKHRPRR